MRDGLGLPLAVSSSRASVLKMALATSYKSASASEAITSGLRPRARRSRTIRLPVLEESAPTRARSPLHLPDPGFSAPIPRGIAVVRDSELESHGTSSGRIDQRREGLEFFHSIRRLLLDERDDAVGVERQDNSSTKRTDTNLIRRENLQLQDARTERR